MMAIKQLQLFQKQIFSTLLTKEMKNNENNLLIHFIYSSPVLLLLVLLFLCISFRWANTQNEKREKLECAHNFMCIAPFISWDELKWNKA